MQKFQVLCVDDDKRVHSAVKHAINQITNTQGYYALNREEAMEHLEKFKLQRGKEANISEIFSLVILDQNLGDFDDKLWPGDIKGAEGLALIPVIKQRISPITRVIMLTAYAGTTEDKGYHAGRERADGYLKKGKIGFPQQILETLTTELACFESAVKFYNSSLIENNDDY